MDSTLENAVVRVVRWLIPALIVSPLLLAAPQASDRVRLGVVTVHLSALVAYGMALTWHLERSPRAWFRHLATPFRRQLASDAAVVALVAGAVALVTLASSAALRLDPSLQYLQLLSALDIAWVVSGIVVGIGRLWGQRVAWLMGTIVAAICVWSIWRYLVVVGFAPDSGWQVEADALIRLVLPFDVMAAVMAVGALVAGARIDAARTRD